MDLAAEYRDSRLQRRAAVQQPYANALDGVPEGEALADVEEIDLLREENERDAMEEENVFDAMNWEPVQNKKKVKVLINLLEVHPYGF